MSVQTRFSTTTNGDITDVQTTCLLAAAPAFTAGFGTLERGTANEEDCKWTNLAGLQLQAMLRGLSKTALTVTEIGGNKRAHLNNSTFEATLLHYIVNNKGDIDGANAWTGNETHAGIEIFADDEARSTTNAAPVNPLSFTNLKYVNDQDALNFKVANLDTDGTLAANSDTRVASQKATKTYVTAQVTGIAGSLFSKVFIAGEAIAAAGNPLAVCLGADNLKKVLRVTIPNDFDFISGGTAQHMGDADAQTRQAQSFVITDPRAVTISVSSFSACIAKVGAPVDTTYFEVRADNAGAPAASAITNGVTNTISGGSLSTTVVWKTYTFATPPVLTSGATYWAVFVRGAGLDGANYYTVESNTGSGMKSQTGSTTAWADEAVGMSCEVAYKSSYGGRVYLADYRNPSLSRVDGFATTNAAAAGNNVTVQWGSEVTGLSALLPGIIYFVNTSGTIATNPTAVSGTAFIAGANTVYSKAALALSTTSVKPDAYERSASGYTVNNMKLSAGGSVSVTLFIETGFWPEYIDIGATWQGGAVSAAGRVAHAAGSAGAGINLSPLDASLRTVTVSSVLTPRPGGATSGSVGSGTSTSISVGTLYVNGFDIVIATTNWATLFPSAFVWHARGR